LIHNSTARSRPILNPSIAAMADSMDTLDNMPPLERVPSHSADPTPAETLEMQADTTGSKSPCQERCCYRIIPAGPPGSGASHRQCRSNPKPHVVLISSPIKSESQAATPRADSVDIDPLSLSTTHVPDDSKITCTSRSGSQHDSDDSMSPNPLYMGYYYLTTTPDKRKSKESIDTEPSHIPTADKEKSRESSCTTVTDKKHSRGSSSTGPSSTKPPTPASGWVGLRGNAVAFRPASLWSFPCVEGISSGGDLHSSEKPNKAAADAHPLEPWRRAGTEIVDFEPGQSPIDALFLLEDEGWVCSQKADSAMADLSGGSNYSPGVGRPDQTADSAMAEFIKESNSCPGVNESAARFRRPSIMAMSESAASDSSEVKDGNLIRSLNGARASSWNGTRTWSWVLSTPDEATDLQQRIELLRDTWRKGEAHLVSGHSISSETGGPIPLPCISVHPKSRTSTVAKTPHQRRQSFPLSHNEELRPLHQAPSNQPGNQMTWESRLNGWPFMDSASDEAEAKSKELSKRGIWDGMEESLREIMKALTLKTSRHTANIWDNAPSWGLVDTPDETTTERFRDRGQCAIIAIHRFMRITQDSLRLLKKPRSFPTYEQTMCIEWEATSTRALLAVLAAGTACNGYMNAIVQGEDERLPFRNAKISGDTKAVLRKRVRVIYEITIKLTALFLKLDMRLAWVSKDHDEKHEAAIKLFDAALEAGLIDPTW